MNEYNATKNSSFLYRYQNIKFYYGAYKNGALDREDYRQLKTLLLKADFWKVSVSSVSEKRYRNIVEDALIILADLFDDGAITVKEFENELQKIRLDKQEPQYEF